MEKKSFPVVNIGTSLILSIFIILALVSFATLTFLSAQKDAAFSDKYVDSAQEWSTSIALANEEISKIDQTLLAQYQAGAFAQEIGKEHHFSVPCGDAVLDVTLIATDPAANNGKLYQITRREKSSSKQWQDNSELNLMQIQ